MQLRTRRVLFWSLIPCFLVGGTGVVLYSQGYRLDSETHEVTKVGALYVRGYPRDAQVTLDGQPLDTASWWPLQSGTLLGSLAPGRYRLRAEAPEHKDWEADVVVRATLVAERKSLTLFPEKSAVVSSSVSGVQQLDLSSSLDELVLVNGEGAHAGGTLLPGSYVGTESGLVVMSSPGKKPGAATVRVQAPEPGSPATSFSVTGNVLGTQEGSVLVQEKPSLVAAYDVSTGRRAVLASSAGGTPVSSPLRTGSHDAWAEGSTLATRPRGSASSPLLVRLPGQVESIQPSGSKLGVLDDLGSLWLVDPGSGSYVEVGHRATWASWNPDGTAVLAQVDGELEVIPLKSGIAHGVLHGTFSGRPGDMGRVRWYPDDEHLFIELGNELAFVDIINGDEAEQHAYRIPRPRDWAFDSDSLTLYLLGGGGEVTSYQFPD